MNIMSRAFHAAVLLTTLLLVAIGSLTSAQSSGVGNVTTLYIGKNISGGPWTAVLQDIGQPNSNGTSPADFAVYYNNKPTNASLIYPGSTDSFAFDNDTLHIMVLQTFAGSSPSDSWAEIKAWAIISYGPATTASLPPSTTTSIAQKTTITSIAAATTSTANASATTSTPAPSSSANATGLWQNSSESSKTFWDGLLRLLGSREWLLVKTKQINSLRWGKRADSLPLAHFRFLAAQ